MVARRQDLVTALTACTENPFRTKARRFLVGLSADELQFIAEFIGSLILESAERCRCSRAELAERVAQFQRTRQQHSSLDDHKMILLLEYLCRSGLQQVAFPTAHSKRIH
jgi:hypothetical protein